MSWLYLDPSAWVKRYVAEPGSDVMDALWEALVRGACFLWLAGF